MIKSTLTSENIKELLDKPEFEQEFLSFIDDLHAHEISSHIEELEPEQISKLLLLIEFPKNVEVFEEFDDEQKRDILLCLTKKDQAKFIEEMSPDERVDLLKIVEEEVRDDIYPLIAQAERNDIKKLIQYEEGSVGSVMTTEYAALHQDLTVKETLERLRNIAPDRETIYYIYIIDNKNNLIGFISLKKLILAKPNTRIKDIMNTEILSVNVSAESESASKIISDYDLLAIPVIDNLGKLVGIVTVDDVVDLVIEEDTEDILHYGAVGKHVNYLRTNPFSAAKQRIIWLFVLVIMGFISGYILERYHDVLDAVVSLVFFIPLLCAAGGNAGTQASTVIIRGLATEELELEDVKQIILKEISIGLFMGICMGGFSAIRAIFVHGSSLALSLSVGLAMLFIILLGNALGAFLPIFLKKIKLDPALMCGPFIASIVDICCIVAYLEIAKYVYHLT